MGFLAFPQGEITGPESMEGTIEDEERFIIAHNNRLYIADGVSILTILVSASYAALADVRFLFVAAPVAMIYTLTRS